VLEEFTDGHQSKRLHPEEYGSDWPVCTRVATLREWVEALKEIISSRGEVERRKLLHDNAVKFYGLV
jgi:predicted TIM-barrel fold metal-dependent hydrolase